VRKAAIFIAAFSLVGWAGAAAAGAARSVPRLLSLDVGANFVPHPATISLGCCGQFVISGPRVSSAAFNSGKLGRIRWKQWGSAQAAGVGILWIDSGLPSCGIRAFRPTSVTLYAFGISNGRYTKLLLVYRSGRHRIFDQRTLKRVRGLRRATYEWFGRNTHGGPAPGVATAGASSITQTAASIAGRVNPGGRSTTYYFQYGLTTSYGSTTASQTVRPGRTAVSVAAGVSGLPPGTTYHFRIYAINAAGAACGPDQTFTTVMTQQQLDAQRAIATYNSMQRYFYAANIYSGDTSSLYTESYPQSGLRYSYLWPFSRALAGTITLSGIPASVLGGASYQAAVADRLTGLSHYWDTSSNPPGYAAYPTSPYGGGGDKYYDDQAWVGLAAAQNFALTGDPTSLADAKNVFNFVYPSGWGGSASFDPGGIYWVNQGVGVGASNHDRTTTSNAPNAEIALLLENFDPANAATYDAAASAIYGWVNHYLYNANASDTDPNAPNPNYTANQPPLMFDKVIGSNNTIDQTLYTYNQGTMIAANVREYQKTGNSAYLSEAEAIAQTALGTFNEAYYITHSAAFNAIYFRGLLVLYSVTANTGLQAQILQTIQTYANDAWDNHRNSQGLFSFASAAGPGYQLLDQGAMLQVYAMLAWNSSDYGKLP